MPANYQIASDLSYAVLLKRREDPDGRLPVVLPVHPIVVNKQLRDLDQARPEDRFAGSSDRF